MVILYDVYKYSLQYMQGYLPGKSIIDICDFPVRFVKRAYEGTYLLPMFLS